MKDFIIKNNRPIIFAAIILVLLMILTTVGLSQPQKSKAEMIENISTCSIPEGKIIAHGIDVSYYQGDVDFDQVKDSGFSFVIIKAGATGFGTDPKFEEYYKEALSAGLDIGCYYYTYSTTVEGAKADAAELLSIIKGKTFNYPVFLDFEDESIQSADLIASNTAMINAFCRKIKKGGYYPGVYTSTSVYYNYIESITLGSTWDFWIASYGDHTYNSNEYHKAFSMWQYSNAGVVKGINADVDLNVSYVDYPDIIQKFREKILKYTS